MCLFKGRSDPDMQKFTFVSKPMRNVEKEIHFTG